MPTAVFSFKLSELCNAVNSSVIILVLVCVGGYCESEHTRVLYAGECWCLYGVHDACDKW